MSSQEPDETITKLLRSGGSARIDLLRYCVLSITMEPVFVFLAGEYRLRPSHRAALALYDLFCERGAPARLPQQEVLPPRNLPLEAAIGSLRVQALQTQSCEPAPPELPVAITTPMRGLFDRVVGALNRGADNAFARIGRHYDPARTPLQNLPDARMTPSQRHFVDRVWKPVVRPRLVEAGFWQVQTLE